MAECSIKENFPQLSWLSGREEMRSVKSAEIPDTTLITITDPDRHEKNKQMHTSLVADHK